MRLLILGGSSEASALVRALAEDTGIVPVLSLAGRTRAPALPPVAVRIGGFGGAAGLADWLRATATEAVVNATHPFAARISANAVAAAASVGLPLLRVLRPAWVAGPGDDWRAVPDMAAAAAAIGAAPRRVLLTIGRQDLAPFAARPQHRYTIRSVDAPPAAALPAGAEVITARGPFAADDEMRLMRARGIEVLVTKNAGGSATEGKLAAARALGVAVVMVSRPALPDCATVPDIAGALTWLRGLAHATLRGV